MIPHDPQRERINPRLLIERAGARALWELLVAQGYVPHVEYFNDFVQALLGREPWLIEGIRGGGKTEIVYKVAKACNLDLYGVSGRKGIKAEELLYAWDREEQREWMREARARSISLEEAEEVKWSKKFLLLGEALGAYEAAANADFPPMLFMDEIDKVGPAIEDMLLQPLANGVMFVPRLRPTGFVGTHDQKKWPIVVAASNNLRHKLSAPFRSRFIYSYIENPAPQTEVLILLAHVPDTSEYLLRTVVKWLDAVRALTGLDDPPAVRESIKLLRALNRDGVTELSEDVAVRYLGLVVKHKGDRDCLKQYLDYVVGCANAPNDIFDSWVAAAMSRRGVEESVGEDEVVAA